MLNCLFQLTTMLQDVMKDDAAITDISPFNKRLDELENKVSRLEQELNRIRAIVDVLIGSKPDTAISTTDDHVDITREAEETAEIAETDEATVSSPEKEETTEKIRKIAADVIQQPGNEFDNFITNIFLYASCIDN